MLIISEYGNRRISDFESLLDLNRFVNRHLVNRRNV